jgi:DNA polymerase-3 subunit delta'
VRPLRHDAVVRGLWRAAAAERLPHALLFHGRRGIGKYRAARWLAQGLFCARGVPAGSGGEPCGACGPCRRFLSGNHPDVLAIDPVETQAETLRLHWLVRRDDSQDGAIAE